MSVSIRALTSAEVADHAPGLAAILLDCVAGGASVGFMADLTDEAALAFWRAAAAGVGRDGRVLLVAEDAAGLVGTVQMVPATMPNQPHRFDIAKLQVHRRGRGAGVGLALMQAAEGAARAAGRTLGVLDTVTGGDAERLYERLGWTRAGVIPDFALMPDGALAATTVFYKRLAP